MDCKSCKATLESHKKNMELERGKIFFEFTTSKAVEYKYYIETNEKNQFVVFCFWFPDILSHTLSSFKHGEKEKMGRKNEGTPA